MRFLKLTLNHCDAVPFDIIGVKIRHGKMYHIVQTTAGVKIVVAKCENCPLYRLLTTGYVAKGPIFEGRKVVIVVRDSRAVRQVVETYRGRIVEALRLGDLTLTPRQREVLRQVAGGYSLSDVADKYGVSKSAVYKHFKKALRKVVTLLT